MILAIRPTNSTDTSRIHLLIELTDSSQYGVMSKFAVNFEANALKNYINYENKFQEHS